MDGLTVKRVIEIFLRHMSDEWLLTYVWYPYVSLIDPLVIFGKVSSQIS